MPALVKSSVGSLGISDALGTRVWPFSSKNLRKVSRISRAERSEGTDSPGGERRRILIDGSGRPRIACRDRPLRGRIAEGRAPEHPMGHRSFSRSLS
jgi:hypothetical protein